MMSLLGNVMMIKVRDEKIVERRQPLEDDLEVLPQSDPDEIEEDPSEGSTPVEFSDADVCEYDPKEVLAAASSDEDQ
ncbi:hypothetical protein RIF29_21072 [Crotalaria pallida]|uniref:Uncharacterized protein n=1 Tax=Crotalaria pallida TaxID=3830 RepID=A0AAN9I824_CROPI